MNVDWLRELCLSFPGATEQIQWGYDLVFKVGGKMFAVTPLEPAPDTSGVLILRDDIELIERLSERRLVDEAAPAVLPAPE